jgi:hypothetical protein
VCAEPITPQRDDANPDGDGCLRYKVNADERRAVTKIKGTKLI